MSTFYCRKWWFPRKRPIEIISEEVARNNHLQGLEYTAVLKCEGTISHIIEFGKKDVFVHFMNDEEMNYITYSFHKDKDKLFLSAAYFHRYKNKQEIELIIFSFQKNGNVYIEKRNFLNNKVLEKKVTTDVSLNWENFPDFGNYARLTVLERKSVLLSEITTTVQE